MTKLDLTRRSFLKLAAATGAVASLSVGVAGQALAEGEAPVVGTGAVKKVRSCCRACGKNECGVYVYVRDGRAIKVEGDADTAFHSMGNSCSKSQASMQAAYHPDRLYYPMKRTAGKGENDPGWTRISWDEAYSTIAQKFHELMDRYGGECMFFMGGTSRIWTQHAYGAWPQLVGSPNAVTAWQICKGPRHMMGEMVSEFAYSWMATTDRPRVFVQWGTATEISNYDESCRATVDIANTADTYISVDPRRTNLNHEADIHQHLVPGTDGALGLSWANVIIENELYDQLFVKRWTDAPFLAVEGMQPSGGVPIWHKIGWTECKPMATTLLKECDLVEGGSPMRFMVWDELAGTDEAHPLHANDASGHLTFFDTETGLWEGEEDTVWDEFYDNPQPNLPELTVPGRVAQPSPFNPDIDPALYGEFDIVLADGKTYKARPVWNRLCRAMRQFRSGKGGGNHRYPGGGNHQSGNHLCYPHRPLYRLRQRWHPVRPGTGACLQRHPKQSHFRYLGGHHRQLGHSGRQSRPDGGPVPRPGRRAAHYYFCPRRRGGLYQVARQDHRLRPHSHSVLVAAVGRCERHPRCRSHRRALSGARRFVRGLRLHEPGQLL